MRLYGRGIRRRLAPMLDFDRRRIELAYSLMFTLPGSPVLRYGEEIGMDDDLRLKEREAIRTPMEWDRALAQRRDPQSLLNWMERIIRMRKEHPAIGWGDWRI